MCIHEDETAFRQLLLNFITDCDRFYQYIDNSGVFTDVIPWAIVQNAGSQHDDNQEFQSPNRLSISMRSTRSLCSACLDFGIPDYHHAENLPVTRW